MIEFPGKSQVSKLNLWFQLIADFIRYKIVYSVEEFLFLFKNYLRNIWIFRKALASHVWWDSGSILYFLELGIDDIRKNIQEKGKEISISRNKKIQKMDRAVQILSNIREDKYFLLAENELGKIHTGKTWFEPLLPNSEEEKQCEGSESEFPSYEMKDDLSEEQKSHNSKIFSRSHELEKLEWEELFQILQGKDNLENLETSEESDDPWGKAYDGSGLKSWWD